MNDAQWLKVAYLHSARLVSLLDSSCPANKKYTHLVEAGIKHINSNNNTIFAQLLQLVQHTVTVDPKFKLWTIFSNKWLLLDYSNVRYLIWYLNDMFHAVTQMQLSRLLKYALCCSYWLWQWIEINKFSKMSNIK